MFRITEAALDFAWMVNAIATAAMALTLLVVFLAHRSKKAERQREAASKHYLLDAKAWAEFVYTVEHDDAFDTLSEPTR